jgi:hypothetical protein
MADPTENPFAKLAAQKKKAAEAAAERAKMTPEQRTAANKAATQGMKTEIPMAEESETAYDAQGRAYNRKVMKKAPAPRATPSPSAKKPSAK